jgi:hypothetical protein
MMLSRIVRDASRMMDVGLREYLRAVLSSFAWSGHAERLQGQSAASLRDLILSGHATALPWPRKLPSLDTSYKNHRRSPLRHPSHAFTLLSQLQRRPSPLQLLVYSTHNCSHRPFFTYKTSIAISNLNVCIKSIHQGPSLETNSSTALQSCSQLLAVPWRNDRHTRSASEQSTHPILAALPTILLDFKNSSTRLLPRTRTQTDLQDRSGMASSTVRASLPSPPPKPSTDLKWQIH